MNKKIDTSVIWNTKFYHCKIQASINFVQIMSTQVYFCGGGGGGRMMCLSDNGGVGDFRF